MKWSKRDLDRDEVRALATRYGCDPLTASILYRRGLGAPEDARFYLEDDPRHLRNPYIFRQMETAVDRLNRAIAGGQTIYLFGDRDVDGVTASVLLSDALRDLGATVVVAVPESDDEYGLTEKWIRSVAERGGKLVVTVDCGISARREIALATELGIEVIITDHHNPPEELPVCLAIIDPKAPGEVYPFRELCGCAVAWKLDWALHWSRAPVYGRDLVLLSTRPGNETVTAEALRLRNGVVRESLSETYVPGALRYVSTRLAAFLGEYRVLAHDPGAVGRDLGTAFGEPPPVSIDPVSAEIDPGQSLLRMLERPESSRYAARPPREIDVLLDLYLAGIARDTAPLVAPSLGRLDLVALGTLSDLMTLRDENRILVRRGMENLSANPRRGLRELLSAQGLLGKRVTTRDVAWKIGPVLNAAGRMGRPDVALGLFLAQTMEDAAKQADALLDLNKQRKALGDKVWDECRDSADGSLAATGGKLIVATGPRIHWGITGVLAARLVSVFHAPAVVISMGPGKCIGSVRSPGGFSLAGFLDQFQDLLTSYGGHDYAAGFSLPPERLEALRSRLLAAGRSLEPRDAEEESLEIDAELPPAYLTPKLATLIDRFEPYGEGNPPLTFLTRKLLVESAELIGKGGGADGPPHARFLLSAETTKWPAVFWNGAQRVRDKVLPATRWDVVYRVERNHFMNMENLRLTVVDLAQ